MTEPLFFKRPAGMSAGEIATLVGAEPASGAKLDRRITGIAPLDRAGPADLTFIDHPRYLPHLGTTAAGLCLALQRFADQAPSRLTLLLARQPYRAFVTVARALFPEALRPSTLVEGGTASGAFLDPTARLEAGVSVDPGAVIGPRAEIGAGTCIGANAVIGADVRIGRNCAIGAGATLIHVLVGDRVVIHPGARIGQDGFGYVPGPGGHLKVPQVGRVIIQDDVEIGANTAIDRGASRDTVIGEGTKVDNLVQIGHNCVIGRHCIIVAQTGISGSVTLGDYVMLGARVGLVDHISVGEGAQIGAAAGVMNDVPPGARWMGAPAKPAKEFFREVAVLKRLGRTPAAELRTAARDGVKEPGPKT
jgi:UDP-3-O-[3-hydroxymyristoyl] glucosamine N-acyltransferase